jgi:hypothetical protein
MIVALFAAASAPLFAQAPSNPDLSGFWLDNSNSADRITLSEKGDTIKVHEQDGERIVTDYTCNLSGKQCDIKEDGRSAKVMLYYDGSKLVEITERGHDVDKRLFSLGQDGRTMQVETIPLSPTGKTITRTFQKEDAQVAKGGGK